MNKRLRKKANVRKYYDIRYNLFVPGRKVTSKLFWPLHRLDLLTSVIDTNFDPAIIIGFERRREIAIPGGKYRKSTDVRARYNAVTKTLYWTKYYDYAIHTPHATHCVTGPYKNNHRIRGPI